MGGGELEEEERSRSRDEVEVVSGEDVCDDVRASAVEEVVGLEESEVGSEDDAIGVEEDEKNEEEGLSRREELASVEVLTLSLEEVEAAVLLA